VKLTGVQEVSRTRSLCVLSLDASWPCFGRAHLPADFGSTSTCSLRIHFSPSTSHATSKYIHRVIPKTIHSFFLPLNHPYEDQYHLAVPFLSSSARRQFLHLKSPIMVTPPEQNFQPQTRDTTNGPHLHTYIPRSDGSILVGGIAYVPQDAANIAATTVPIGVPTVVPVATQPIVQPISPYPVNFPYYIYGQAASVPASFLSSFFPET
jgi:hypothetical protein